MPWVDDIVSWFSPRAGIKRHLARAALQHARSYDAAGAGRRNTGWTTTGTSANAEIGPNAKRLRENSRELLRNNPYAVRAIAGLVANSIGTGIYAKTDQLQPLWDKWVDECDADGDYDFFGLQSLAARTVYESGECFVRKRIRRLEDGLAVPLQLQVLEPDYLDTSKIENLANGGVVLQGIEFDPLGRRVAYWMFSKHPGESGFVNRELQSRRIPADQVFHIYEKQRPGQVRGVPRLASAMMKMRDLGDYEDAELVRKKIEACLAAFVTTSDESMTLGKARTENAMRIESFEPGMVEYLQPGESVAFNTPTKSDGYGAYTQTQLMAIAAGIGVTYEQLTGDLSRVNYSSMRAGMVEFRRMVTMWQWLTFIPKFCKPVFRSFAETAVIFGKAREADYRADWTTPKWEYVNPKDDVASSKEAIRGGLKSLSECIREQGYDPKAVFAEIAEERALLASLGVRLDIEESMAGNDKTVADTAKDDKEITDD